MSLDSVATAIAEEQQQQHIEEPSLQLKPPSRGEVLDMEKLLRTFDDEYSSSLLDNDVDMVRCF